MRVWAETITYKILFVEFVQGSSFLAGTTVESLNSAQESFVKIAGDLGSNWSDFTHGWRTVKADVQGTATLVSVEDGVFFVDGFFVKSNNSFTVPFGASGSIERYFKDPTAQVGFDITRQNSNIIRGYIFFLIQQQELITSMLQVQTDTILIFP